MSSNRDAKVQKVAEIQNMMQRAKSIVFVNYIGLNVLEATELRNQFRAAGVEYKVLKNTLVEIAAGALELKGFEGILKGTTGLAFSYEDPIAGPKVLRDFIAKTKKTEIKGGLLGKTFMSAKQVDNLASIPSKEVLVSVLMSVMNAPARGLVTVLNQIPTGLVRALDAVKRQKASA